MSVFIKGMEMPEDCATCGLNQNEFAKDEDAAIEKWNRRAAHG